MSLRWSVFGVESIYQFPSKIARGEIVCIPTMSSSLHCPAQNGRRRGLNHVNRSDFILTLLRGA